MWFLQYKIKMQLCMCVCTCACVCTHEQLEIYKHPSLGLWDYMVGSYLQCGKNGHRKVVWGTLWATAVLSSLLRERCQIVVKESIVDINFFFFCPLSPLFSSWNNTPLPLSLGELILHSIFLLLVLSFLTLNSHGHGHIRWVP